MTSCMFKKVPPSWNSAGTVYCPAWNPQANQPATILYHSELFLPHSVSDVVSKAKPDFFLSNLLFSLQLLPRNCRNPLVKSLKKKRNGNTAMAQQCGHPS